MFLKDLGDLPWPCYILDLLIPAICDACARMLVKCIMQGLGSETTMFCKYGDHGRVTFSTC